jgi:hypothetical protein
VLEITLKLLGPFVQEIVSGFEHLIGLLLALKILSHEIDLHVGLSFTIADLTFKLMHFPSEFLGLSLVADDEIIKRILFCDIFGF